MPKLRTRKRNINLTKHFPERMTYRQKEFVQNLVVGGLSPREAALQAGYSPTTPVSQTLKKSAVVTTIQSIMDEADITDTTLIQVLKDGLSATKLDGPEHSVEVEDFKTRHAYLTTGLRLRGHLTQDVNVKHTVETYEERLARLAGENVIEAEFSEE